MIIAECQEKEGTFTRVVRPMPRDPWLIREAVKKMRKVPNFLGKENPYDVLLDESVIPLQVDDVGIILLKPQGEKVEVHITFWDGRLRGREELCQKVAERVLKHYKVLWTAVPKDSRFVRAFAERVGFEATQEKNGAVVYVMRRNNGT